MVTICHFNTIICQTVSLTVLIVLVSGLFTLIKPQNYSTHTTLKLKLLKINEQHKPESITMRHVDKKRYFKVFSSFSQFDFTP